MENKLKDCTAEIRKITSFVPKIAIVLGSGLGGFAEKIEIEAVIPYSKIKGFPTSTVTGHEGRFVLGYCQKVPVIIMQGRVHYYEGYTMEDVVLPIKVMKRLGAQILVLTNAAGGINEAFRAGDFMLIEDHISSFVPSPLIGRNDESLGTRFPDMSSVYSPGLREIVQAAANAQSTEIKKGVYIQTSGPNYETPQEIKMYRTLGADAVGMSTACEAMAANHMGMEICGISCISNMAAGVSKKPLTHAEVKETADRVSTQFEALISETVRLIGERVG